MNRPFDPLSRRAFLGRSAGSLGALALTQLLGPRLALASNPPKPSQHRPRAKAIISLFQHGGPSQMDLFDCKPALNKWSGKPYPGGDLEVHFDKQAGNVLGAPYEFRPRGQCGMELSELLPHTGTIADEITLVRSMTTGSGLHCSTPGCLRRISSGCFCASTSSTRAVAWK